MSHPPLQSERDRLILEHLDLVRRVVRRMAVGADGVDQDDLISAGVVGLIDAVDRFDGALGGFVGYAAIRIRGAVLDALRELDWASRTVRRGLRALEQARREHEAQRGEVASEHVLAAALGLSLRRLRRLQQHAAASFCSLDAEVVEGWPLRDTLSCDAPSPFECVEARRRAVDLRRAIASLDWREQRVLRSYYWERRSLRQIGSSLGVSESRVSQLHSRARAKLRASGLVL